MRCGKRVEGRLVSGEKVWRGMGCGMEGECCEWEEGTSEMCVLKHFHSYKTHASVQMPLTSPRYLYTHTILYETVSSPANCIQAKKHKYILVVVSKNTV